MPPGPPPAIFPSSKHPIEFLRKFSMVSEVGQGALTLKSVKG